VFVLWLILYYTGSRGLQTSIKESTHKYDVAAWLEEIARVIKSLKLSQGTQLHMKKTDENVSNYINARTSHFNVLLVQFRTLVGFKTVITAAMLIVGSILLVNNQLNIGQFIAAEIVIITVINSVEKLIGNLDSVYDVLTSVEKLSNITDQAIEENGNYTFISNKQGVKLEMKNVHFGYLNNGRVLNNVNIEINPGEKVCVLGKDGSGKSTLLKMFTGSFKDFEGSVLINNIPVGNYELSSLRSNTGILLNQQDIFRGTLWENITMGNENTDMNTVVNYADKVGLTDFIHSLKEGFDTQLDTSGVRLPRNVVHKILLLRALANKPELLLLEEPWMGLQEEYKKQIQELLLNNLHGSTLLVVTNDEEFALQCDKIIDMSDGECITKLGMSSAPSGGEGV
jgi:ATP-binding cassette, subfamily B, bacterial